MVVAATWDGTTDKSYSGLTTSDTLALSGVKLANIIDVTAPFGADAVLPGTFVITAASGSTLTFTNTTIAALDALLGSSTALNTTVDLGSDVADLALTGGLAAGFGLDDVITGGTVASALFGGTGGDSLSGSTGDNPDTLYGGAGNDSLTALGGGSVLYGGANDAAVTTGVDTINAGGVASSGVTIYGGTGTADLNDGADTITGSSNADVIYGNAGNDSIVGGGGADTIYGGYGDDLVTASAGSDGAVLYGSAGNDTIDASAVLTATGVTIYGGTGASDPTDGADSITGSSGSDAIYGNGGNDTINGGAGGQDSLYGGAGNDAMTGGDTGTVIYGGAGSDAITATAASTIYGGSGVSDPTDGADVITGSGLADSIYGNGGNDSIASGGGADNIFGGAGDDTITASGAAANATLTGGDGADVFVFSETGSDTATLPTVTDFTTGTDHLDFGFAAAPTLTHATSLADFLTNAPTGTNTASWVSNGSGGVFVAAGTGALTIYAQLNNVTSISTSDFLPHAT